MKVPRQALVRRLVAPRREALIYARPRGPPEVAPVIPGPRWNSIDAFLDDLPRRHCTVKPADNFCSVCLRINSEVAFDCPLRFPSYELPPAMRPALGPVPAQWRPPPMPGMGPPVHHVPPVPPPPPLLAQEPLIEFARQTEPHQAPKRMKAKAVSKRGDARPAPPAPAPPPPDDDFEIPSPQPDHEHSYNEGHEQHHNDAPPASPSEDLEAPDNSATRRRFRQR